MQYGTYVSRETRVCVPSNPNGHVWATANRSAGTAAQTGMARRLYDYEHDFIITACTAAVPGDGQDLFGGLSSRRYYITCGDT